MAQNANSNNTNNSTENNNTNNNTENNNTQQNNNTENNNTQQNNNTENNNSVGPEPGPEPTDDASTTKEDGPEAPPQDNTSSGNKLLGEECQVTSECKTDFKCVDPGGLGKKVCTKTCTDNPDCPSGSLCDKHPPLTSYCVPTCTNDSECNTAYAHTPVCASEGHCWVPKPMSDACERDSECATGLKCADPGGLGRKVCTAVCTGDSDCSAGGGGFCDKSHPGLTTTYCLKKCTQDTDCALLPSTSVCSSEGHCWGQKPIGGTCSTDAQCQTGLTCADPGNLGSKVCTKSCTADGDCPNGKCQDSQCLPRCSQDAECSSFTTLFKCDAKGYCWKQ
ncbi:MAG: hypothetical protein EP343_16790 [Deltaproteobacteria bacterium]|nr:MAG: hypothetical protein EP343_16790 [Deltaproteobacteria bacterium]